MKKENSLNFWMVFMFVFLWTISLGMFAQNITVKGTVVDSQNEPIIGANIIEKGTSNGTVTDYDGNFTLNISSNAVLRVSYIGYLEQEISTENKKTFNIVLIEDTKTLDELVVVGYGTQRKKDITGSVVRADMTALQESPNVSLGSALQGILPGLNVGAVTQAGTDPGISIRGRTSISGSNSPLIVLDGIIYRGQLVDLNFNDVESVDVLKDASATAIYGSQASNGVILITSKKGRVTEKPIISYSASYSMQEISNKDMLPEDGAGFIRKIGDRFLSESRTGTNFEKPNTSWDPASKFYGPEILKGYQNGIENNWWNLLTNKNPYIHNQSLSISGSSKSSSYFLSLGYVDQENVLINDDFKRYNFRVNLDTEITNWFKIGIQSFMTISDYSGVSPSISSVVGLPPQVPYIDDEGEYILQIYRAGLNPFYQMDQQDLRKRNNLFANIYADINIPFIKGLNYRLNFSQSLIDNKQFNFDSYAANFTGRSNKMNSSAYALTVDNILSYNRSFGKHSINGTFVYGLEERQYESTDAVAEQFDSNKLGYNSLQAGKSDLQSVNSSAWEESSLFQMLRLGYNYNDRYIFTGTVRRDGFSGFSPGNKFGTFPSASFAWRLSEESFMKESKSIIDDLKIRLAYGSNGNRTSGRYSTLSKISSSYDQGYLYGDGSVAELGQRISSLPNPNLKWETTNTLNFGADFVLFNNRLSGSVEYYTAKTKDLLYDINIPIMNGFGSIPMNIGKLNNIGQEISISGIPIVNNDFRWDVTVNFSRNRNKVVSILGLDKNGDGKEDDLISSKIFMDHPYGVVYDFNIIGMWQLEDYHNGKIPSGFTYGTYKVEDINEDGKYTAGDDRKILGYTDPSYRFSILNTLTYKDWQFKFFINSIQGGKDYYYGQPGSSLPNPDNIYGENRFNWDYWTPENSDARYKQLGYYTVALGETFSPYVQRSFVRLQNVSLAYNLPESLLKDIKINRIKVYLSGDNLLTFTDWDGWDPETGTGLSISAYPLLKSYSFGINIEF